MILGVRAEHVLLGVLLDHPLYLLDATLSAYGDVLEEALDPPFLLEGVAEGLLGDEPGGVASVLVLVDLLDDIFWVFDDLGLAPFEEHDGLEDIVQLDPPLLGGALLVALLPLHWHVELLPLLPVRLPQGLLLSLVSQVRSHCKGWLEIFLHSLVEVLLC
eukprot:CAMPEP_0170550746 /NCGR_PEP_ID=MMETSP0211-20121228/8752_1 /TAXON_ID=311385 /ORGANISM="Pseudokeronopsis sp., Strain OXSARD2" /LENGTH=159 /DNA_ID=CAMNT_0010857449 /DNA_START=385 /DNA_END=864 /DNA_ORIENTATION=-